MKPGEDSMLIMAIGNGWMVRYDVHQLAKFSTKRKKKTKITSCFSQGVPLLLLVCYDLLHSQ